VFVWGTKVTRSQRGWVADFCPLCRGLRPCRLLKVGLANHIWYLPLGSGRFVGNEIACGVCDSVFETEGSRYASVSDDLVGVDELVRRTLPSDRRVEELIARETRLAEHRLQPDERVAMLREVILYGADQAERQIEERRYPRQGRLVGWATFGLFLLWVFAGQRVPPVPQAILAGLFAAGLLGCLYFMATCVGHHIRGVVEPAVARGLAPLRPTREEIGQALAHAQTLGSRGAKKLKVQRLYDALQGVSQSG